MIHYGEDSGDDQGDDRRAYCGAPCVKLFRIKQVTDLRTEEQPGEGSQEVLERG